MSSKLEITGELKHISEIVQLPGGADKRIFVIEIEPGQYSQEIAFELFKDKVSLINSFQLGDTITVFFNLRGRPYNDKWYVNLQAYRIALTNATATSELFND